VTLQVRRRHSSLGRVYSPLTGDLSFEERDDGFVAATVPRVAIHEIVVLEYEGERR